MHPDLALSLNNLAMCYTDIGLFDNALASNQEANHIFTTVYGEKHPSVATSYNNLALSYAGKGEYEKAIQIHEKVIEIQKKVFGDYHPDLGNSFNNLGMCYFNIKQIERGIETLEKALDIYKNNNSNDSKQVYIVSGNLGALYSYIGQYTKALDYHKSALNNISKYIDLNATGLTEDEKNTFLNLFVGSFSLYESLLFNQDFNDREHQRFILNNTIKLDNFTIRSSLNMRKEVNMQGDQQLLELYNKWIQLRQQLC
jgi:tetratricopeptide (TPR) repeat protein